MSDEDKAPENACCAAPTAPGCAAYFFLGEPAFSPGRSGRPLALKSSFLSLSLFTPPSLGRRPVVLIRFGHDADPVCMLMDETLSKIADAVKNFCIIYCVDITEVPDFNEMYELYDPMAIM